ncbi:MAG TPA: protein kinase [Thermoanaerobaculia bacterium]|nr:protein kinase [Thermoanaerobaculia bacterium]
MLGSTVSHYRIIERLGGGGKGVVYKAQDLRLQRFVALKFLSMAAAPAGEPDEEVQRFLREARAASAIEHPNLCTVYEIDESDDGQLFIAMAFCEGETLKAKLERGPLELELAVDLAVQIAAGLGKAHERGIVHRDVKPANIIVTPEGQAKIVDFGIAHLTGQTRLTRAGSMVGTAAYMSPEQLRSTPADPRMDLWAIGVVLYEMVTGRPPFRGEDRVLLYSILNRNPASMASLRPGVPSALDRTVSRLLAKNPADRFADTEELRIELCSLRWSSAVSDLEATPTATPTFESSPPPAAEPAPSEQRPEPSLIDRSVSHYRIVQRLGGGGMGVVYKAEDTLLQRKAALKFLPRRLTLDPGGKERFLQEARTASGLDHPNLCTIYEVGETAEGQLFLAMPLYDGETLRKRLERGPLPVLEAVDLATQMAQGLARVHRRGIVHQDIKPANLMITGDGILKILDFGIATLASDAGVAAEGAAAIGTPAYMSPEQAAGGEVGPRSDLWALGVVLYEMLAGRRPFRGDQEQAVIYALLHEAPEPLARLRPDVPPELDRIVQRLLAKDPAARYASADEVFADLRRLFGEASGAYFAPTLPGWGGPARDPRRLWAVVLAVALVALGGLFLARFLPGDSDANPFVGARFNRLTNLEGREMYPSLAPDGASFVYVKADGSDFDVFLQVAEDGARPVNLTGDSPGDDTQPVFAPQGDRLVFRSERQGGGLFLMNRDGGGVHRLTNEGYTPAWSPDAREIVYATEWTDDPELWLNPVSELRVVEVATGRSRPLTAGIQPSWSPDGRWIAFWGIEESRRVLWTVAARGGKPQVVLDDDHINWNPVWSPDSRFLYFVSDQNGSMNLWRMAVDPDTGRAAGDPQPITTPSPSVGWLSFSADGSRLLYATNESKATLERASFDPATLRVNGALEPVAPGLRSVRAGEVSPDGRWFAFDTAGPQEDLFLVRTDGREDRQLTDDPFKDRLPRWSPDGSRIVFYSERGGDTYQLWEIRPDGTGLRQLTYVEGDVNSMAWAPDGQRLAASVENSARPVLVDLTLPDAARKDRVKPLGGAGVSFAPGAWSPDGRRIAGENLEGLVLYDVGTGSVTHFGKIGVGPVWLRDNRTLLIRQDARLRILDLGTGKVRDILGAPFNSTFQQASLSRDERQLYVVRVVRQGDICLFSAR